MIRNLKAAFTALISRTSPAFDNVLLNAALNYFLNEYFVISIYLSIFLFVCLSI